MYLLKATALILFFNAGTPVPDGTTLEILLESRDVCEAQRPIYGQRLSIAVADELKRSDAPAIVAGVDTSCEPFDRSGVR